MQLNGLRNRDNKIKMNQKIIKQLAEKPKKQEPKIIDYPLWIISQLLCVLIVWIKYIFKQILIKSLSPYSLVSYKKQIAKTFFLLSHAIFSLLSQIKDYIKEVGKVLFCLFAAKNIYQ